MKNAAFFLTLASFLFLGLASAYAQEAEPETSEELPVVQPASEEIPNPNEIGALEAKNSPAVVRSEPAPRTAPATSAAAPSAKSKGDKTAEKSEDDALSFNFLFYIIQKFKISDLKNN